MQCVCYVCVCAVCCCAAGEKRLEITAQRGQQAVLLSDHDRDRLEDMLRGLTAERASIAEVRPNSIVPRPAYTRPWKHVHVPPSISSDPHVL